MNFINLYKQAGIGLANNYNICTQLLLHHLNAEVPHQWNMAGFSISHVIHKKLTERMYLLLNLGFRKELQSAWVENSYCESVIHFTSYFFCLRTSPHLSSINMLVFAPVSRWITRKFPTFICIFPLWQWSQFWKSNSIKWQEGFDKGVCKCTSENVTIRSIKYSTCK